MTVGSMHLCGSARVPGESGLSEPYWVETIVTWYAWLAGCDPWKVSLNVHSMWQLTGPPKPIMSRRTDEQTNKSPPTMAAARSHSVAPLKSHPSSSRSSKDPSLP